MAKKKETVETAAVQIEKKEVVTTWKRSERWYVCPTCGHEVNEPTLKYLKRCPVCGTEA